MSSTIHLPTLSEYQETLYRTLPPGTMFPPINEDSNTRTLVDSIAYDTRLVAVDGCEMLDSSFPNSSAYIADWEEVLGLPHKVLSGVFFQTGLGQTGQKLSYITKTSVLPTDIDVRIAQVLTFFKNDGLNNVAFYESLANLFDLTITVTTTTAFEVSINIISGPAGNVVYFTLLANFYKPVYVKLTIT